ncbi:Predicted dithiol-disulfide isomerase, DsbA family [Bhargavaea ginsengi]|uniref:Predicted dithiol-disulfide isomerase, DsbA family n=1 Tax=Bhargavaea ginsengi TaxID=426757 RepID=A0A1H7BDK3_9BACL|nr:DsbA family oxidoreductase [Bhargavaea ginsengi]SEJ75759.1 Predicted dithiol-disulfide isomerase, DsbA family [Bhargavaea ginsengi]
MKIEVWSDYVCPFCYIGKRKLEQALEKTGLGTGAEVIFKSYELDPNSPETSDQSMVSVLAGKYGTTEAQAEDMTANVTAAAKEVGLEYNFSKMRPANTFSAHRLAKWAEEQGKADEISENLLRAYFIENREIGLKEVLADIAEETGLGRAEAEAVLKSERYEKDVRADIEEARQLGVQGVPFFVINRKYAISGAQPDEVFEQALRQVAEEES